MIACPIRLQERCEIFIARVFANGSRPGMDQRVLYAATEGIQRIGYSTMKPEQLQVVSGIVSVRDVFAVLPTRFGKSLCYACPPTVYGLVLPVEGTDQVHYPDPNPNCSEHPRLSCCSERPRLSCCSERPRLSCCSERPWLSCCSEHPRLGCCSERPRLSCCSEHPRLSCCSEHPRLSCCSERPRLSCSERPRLSCSERPRLSCCEIHLGPDNAPDRK